MTEFNSVEFPLRSAKMSFAESCLAVDDLLLREKSDPAQSWHSLYFGHGRVQPRAVLFFHGFTNAPPQFARLGQLFHARGYNVFIPSLPYHGLSDRSGRSLQSFRLEKAHAFAHYWAAVTAAQGVHLTVVGLSGGANLAAWLAMTATFPKIDLTVLISPLFNLPGISRQVVRVLLPLISFLPEIHLWWDGKAQNENPHSPPYAYTGFTARGMSEIVKAGLTVQNMARMNTPVSHRLLMIANANDSAINLKDVHELNELWQSNMGERYKFFEFPREQGLVHDFITPDVSVSRAEEVYPTLLNLIDGK